jgi:hypothetical protein
MRKEDGAIRATPNHPHGYPFDSIMVEDSMPVKQSLPDIVKLHPE